MDGWMVYFNSLFTVQILTYHQIILSRYVILFPAVLTEISWMLTGMVLGTSVMTTRIMTGGRTTGTTVITSPTIRYVLDCHLSFFYISHYSTSVVTLYFFSRPMPFCAEGAKRH